MAKIKNPLFSLNVTGSLRKAISFRKRGKQTIAQKTPIPTDLKSLAQLSWRHMYQKATALWHALSPAEQADWETQARPRHMTGFAWFMSQCLKPNPGIYLPLQGGSMQGDIDMATHKITDLPQPTADQQAATKKYIDDLPSGELALWRFRLHGRYHYSAMSRKAGNVAIYTMGGGRLYAAPWYTPVSRTITRMLAYVITASPGNARLGIYQDDGSIYPGILISDCGEISTTSTGSKIITGLSISLSPGVLYWLVITGNAAGGNPKFQSFIDENDWIVLGSSAQLSACGRLYYKDHAYGTLPDPFPVGASIGTSQNVAIGLYWD